VTMRMVARQDEIRRRLAGRPILIPVLAMAAALGACLPGGEVPRLRTVAVGQWPEDILFDPGSDRVFVADEGSATITVLSADGQKIGTIALHTRARHVAVDPALGHLYAPNEGSDFVSAFNTRDLGERYRVSVGRQPHGIAVDRASHRVFVGNEAEDSLTAFDGRTGRVLYTVPVGPGPGGVAADPVTGRVFVVSVKADRVAAIDGGTGARLAEIPVGRGPTHLGINTVSGMVYVVNTEERSVSVLDGREIRLRATLPLGNYPLAVAVDEKAGRGYVVNNRENTLSIVEEASLKVIGMRRIPRNVSSVARNPHLGLLYFTLKSDDQVALVHVRDLGVEPAMSDRGS